MLFVITDLASVLSNGVTEGCGLMAGFKGFVSPLTSGLLIYSTVVYLVPSKGLPATIIVIVVTERFVVDNFHLMTSSGNIIVTTGC